MILQHLAGVRVFILRAAAFIFVFLGLMAIGVYSIAVFSLEVGIS